MAAAAAGVILIGGMIFFYSRKISYNAFIKSDVSSKVVVTRDSNGIPEIKAQNLSDFYFSLGYTHAKDRLGMMEYLRSVANARASRLIGRDGLVLERFATILGFAKKGDETEKTLKKPYSDYIASYVAGINLFRKEGSLSKIDKADWVAADIISMFYLLEWTNSYLNNKELMVQIPADKRDRLIKDYLPEDKTFFYADDQKLSVDVLNKLKKLLASSVGVFNNGYAFCVASKYSQGGSRFSAYSNEDSSTLYPGWYPVQASIDKIKIRGITFAGLPFIFSGNNSKLSFFGYNLKADTQDFIFEKVEKINGVVHYQSAQGWKKFIPLREPAEKVKGVQSNVVVWASDNGPVINDIFSDEEYRLGVTVIRFFLPGEDYISSLFEIPFFEDEAKARESLRNISSYPKVYMFVSDKTSTVVCSGRSPVRHFTGNLFVDGSAPVWTGFTDYSIFSEQSQDNLICGSFVLPDQINQRADLKNYLSWDNEKLKRVKDLTSGNLQITESSIVDILKDNYSVHAEILIPEFVSILKTNPVTSARLARIYFNSWKYNMSSTDIAPLLFHSLLKNFIYETYADDYREGVDSIVASYHHILPFFEKLVLEKKASVFDDKVTENIETRETIFDRALLKAMRSVSRETGPVMDNWQWGKFHYGHFRIPFEESSFLSRRFYHVKNMEYDGGVSTLCSGLPSPDGRPDALVSVAGYYSSSNSKVYQNYGYSTHPMSDFYYGKTSRIDFADFDKTGSKYVSEINPLK